MRLPDISASMRASFKTCPRRLFYRYVAGVEQKKTPSTALQLGRAFHFGLELWRSGEIMVDAVGRASSDLTTVLAATTDLNEDQIEDEVSRLEAMLGGYKAVFHEDKKFKWEVELKVEGEGEVAFIDAARVVNDCLFVVEDKTRAAFSDDTRMALRMDEQLLNYQICLEDAGYMVGGFFYRESRKPQVRRTKKETGRDYNSRVCRLCIEERDKYYREFLVGFDPVEVERYRIERTMLDQRIRDHFAGGLACHLEGWPRNSQSCLGKYGSCEFLALCANQSDIMGQAYQANNKEPLDGGEYRDKVWGCSTAGNTAEAGELPGPAV
jgi:hypothetical protein